MKLLVPVDKSRRDGIVLPYSVRMAKALSASLVVAHVLRLTRSLIPNAMRQAEAYVAAVAEGLREQGLAVESIVRRGDAASMIVTLAAELQVDLILMTTRGRSSLGKLVLGSVANAVLSNCHKPVLLLSEVAESMPSDEEVRLQSAYLATVIWHSEARGLYTRDQAEKELTRLARAGLDPGVLLASYQAQEQQGILFGWLDFDFQLSTLRRFLPEEADAFIRYELPQLTKARAA